MPPKSSSYKGFSSKGSSSKSSSSKGSSSNRSSSNGSSSNGKDKNVGRDSRKNRRPHESNKSSKAKGKEPDYGDHISAKDGDLDSNYSNNDDDYEGSEQYVHMSDEELTGHTETDQLKRARRIVDRYYDYAPHGAGSETKRDKKDIVHGKTKKSRKSKKSEKKFGMSCVIS